MMSLAAARKAVERAGIDVGQIDTVIVSTVTHLYQTPGRGDHDRQRARGQERRGVRHLRRLRRLLLRHRDGRLVHPHRRVDVRVDHRRRAAERHDQPRGPLDRVPLRRRGRRRRGRPERHARHRPGGLGLRRRPGGPDHADRAVGPGHGRQPSAERASGRCCGWRATPSSSGPPTPWPRRRPRRSTGPAYGPRTSTCSSRTRPTCGSPTPCSGPSSCPPSVVVARDIACQGNTSAASIPLAIEALLESGEAERPDLLDHRLRRRPGLRRVR